MSEETALMADDSLSGLQSLLSPVSNDAFFERYWEKAPLHVSRAETGRFADLASDVSIEQLISTQELYFPSVQLVGGIDPVVPSDYTDSENRIIAQRLVQGYHQGSTLVITRAHRLLPSIATLCRRLSSELQWRCQGNLYLSPAGQQGFNAHYDTHDVIVVQVSGRKLFRFYARGADLPFPQSQFEPTGFDAGEATDEVMLEPGHTLYIPRGLTHAAVAGEADSSVHLTIGIFPMTVRDLLQEAIEVAAEEELELRRALPRSWYASTATDAAQVPENTLEALGCNLTKVLGRARIDKAFSRLLDEAALENLQSCEGLLRPEHPPESHWPDARIRLRVNQVTSVERDSAGLHLRAAGQVLDYEPPMDKAVEHLLDGKPQIVAELAGLSATQQLTLVRSLVAANLITFEETRQEPIVT